MYCISFPRDFSYIKQQVSPASDTNSIEGNNISGKQGTTLTAARKQKQRAIISIFFCQFHSGELRGKLNEKVHFLMDRGSTPPPAPPRPSPPLRTWSRHTVIGVVFGLVKFAGSPPINAESLSQEGLRLQTGIQKSITQTRPLLASLIHLFYSYFLSPCS